jgi:hypothetical protein
LFAQADNFFAGEVEGGFGAQGFGLTSFGIDFAGEDGPMLGDDAEGGPKVLM